MVVTAWVMLELEGDRPDAEGDPILMRGDNRACVSWVTRCGGATDKRAFLLMRMLGRLELAGGWNHTAKHICGCTEHFNGWHFTMAWVDLRRQGQGSDQF